MREKERGMTKQKMKPALSTRKYNKEGWRENDDDDNNMVRCRGGMMTLWWGHRDETREKDRAERHKRVWWLVMWWGRRANELGYISRLFEIVSLFRPSSTWSRHGLGWLVGPAQFWRLFMILGFKEPWEVFWWLIYNVSSINVVVIAVQCLLRVRLVENLQG